MEDGNMTGRLAVAVAALEALRGQIGEIEGKELSDAQFANRFLPFSAASYSKLQTPEKYGARIDAMTVKCEEAVERIRARIEALQKRAAADSVFVKTRFAQSALGAWQRCQDDDGTRVIWLLGPTGSGKSEIGRHMVCKFNATLAEGRQSWRSSNKAFCRDVAAAARSPISARVIDEHYAEQAMLEALGPKAGTLYVDEANTLGTFVANSIKLIANQTLQTVVVAAIPEMFDEFIKRAANEVRQVLNRTQAVIRFPGVTESEARQFLSGCGISAADMPEAARRAMAAGNAAGAYKLIKRVAADLRDQDAPTLADVDKAIALARSALDEANVVVKK